MTWESSRPYRTKDGFRISEREGGSQRTVASGVCRADADLRKMAAASDMYEALYTALPYVEDALLDDGYKPEAVRAAINKVRAALSQGEQG